MTERCQPIEQLTPDNSNLNSSEFSQSKGSVNNPPTLFSMIKGKLILVISEGNYIQCLCPLVITLDFMNKSKPRFTSLRPQYTHLSLLLPRKIIWLISQINLMGFLKKTLSGI